MTSGFLAVNRKSAEGTCMAVHITPHEDNDGGTDDQFKVTINTSHHGGQHILLFGKEVKFISFVIVGNTEIDELHELIGAAMYNVRESLT